MNFSASRGTLAVATGIGFLSLLRDRELLAALDATSETVLAALAGVAGAGPHFDGRLWVVAPHAAR